MASERNHVILMILLFHLFLSPSWAFVSHLPTSLAQEVLSETVPTAFSPGELSLSDFQLKWKQVELQDLKWHWVEDSLQWVRVSDVLVIPRARLVLKSTMRTGYVKYQGFFQPF